jgi:hypothetical protein
MRRIVLTLILAVIGLALPHPSQAAGAVMGVPGFYDQATGTFVPMVVPKVVPLVSVARTGTVKIIITLSIEAAIGPFQPITCQASIFASDVSFDNSASASGFVVRSGAKGTLTMLIPYNWTMVANGELASMSVNCSDNSFNTGGVGHSIGFTVPGFIVPATAGAITTKTLAASM